MYATTDEGGAHTILSYDLATGQTSRVFSDVDAKVKLMPRGGARDSVNVIRANHRSVVAVAREQGERTPAGALYELCLDGSNRVRKIAPIDSEVPVERIALDRSAKRVAYPHLQRDPKFVGEGQSRLVSTLIIHDTETGAVLRKISLSKRPARLLISFLAWGPTDETLYVRLDGDPKREGLYEVSSGPLKKLPLHFNPLKKVVEQSARGDFLMTYLGSRRFTFESRTGQVVREGMLGRDYHGWHYELSDDGRRLALQTISNELWVRDLESGKEAQVPLTLGGAGVVTLIGWAEGEVLRDATCVPR
jgi:hypothetical protein